MKTNIFILSIVALVMVFPSSSFAYSHTVQKGETMWLIAKKYNVPFSEVLRLNSHYKNPDLIHPLQKILLPDSAVSISEEPATESMAEAVLNLVNQERGKQGLKPLTLSSKLNELADLKAKDMAINNYFSHTSPTYGSPFDMLSQYGISYRTAGENIAKGQKTAAAVMKSWMNSEGHRANILSDNFDSIGIGYSESSQSPIWTQLFTGS